MDQNPIQGGICNIPSCFMLHENQDKIRLGGPVVLSTDLRLVTNFDTANEPDTKQTHLPDVEEYQTEYLNLKGNQYTAYFV